MKNLLRLPRWLAGAFLLFTVPSAAHAFAPLLLIPMIAIGAAAVGTGAIVYEHEKAKPAAYDCATVKWYHDNYTEAQLAAMAKSAGLTDAQMAEAQKCLTSPNVVAKKPKTLLKPKIAPVKKQAPAVVTAPQAIPYVPTQAPVVVAPDVTYTPTPITVPEAAPVKSSWLAEFLEDLGFVVLIGTALGLLVTWGSKFYKAYRAEPAVTITAITPGGTAS